MEQPPDGAEPRKHPGHILLPEDIRAKLPKLYEQEVLGEQAIAHVKIFGGAWTWYVTEFDGEDLCFGFVIGLEREWGYFSLRELETVRIPLVVRTPYGPRKVGEIPLERDLYFKPTPMKDILADAGEGSPSG